MLLTLWYLFKKFFTKNCKQRTAL